MDLGKLCLQMMSMCPMNGCSALDASVAKIHVLSEMACPLWDQQKAQTTVCLVVSWCSPEEAGHFGHDI